MGNLWTQLDLFGPASNSPPLAEEPVDVLRESIAKRLDGNSQLRLTIHNNRSTMMSFRRVGAELRLRLHRMFLGAPAEVVDAVARYAVGGKGTSGATLDTFIRQRYQAPANAVPRKLDARGRTYDLDAMYARLNAAHFQGTIRARIGWGRDSPRRRRRTVRLGVYDHHAREIRVNPALDHPQVPAYFVEYIVFHEMLHQLFPSERTQGRNVHHPKAFRERERTYPDYARAIAWEKAHLPRALCMR